MSKLNLNEFEGHTPGPWYVDDAPDVKHPSVVLADDGATIVAEAMTVVAEQHDAGANAQLIAAAPDLLAEVKRLRERLDLAERYIIEPTLTRNYFADVVSKGLDDERDNLG